MVSASPASKPATVARYQAPLTAAAQEAGLKLILAGGGAWKESGQATRVLAFKELREALA